MTRSSCRVIACLLVTLSTLHAVAFSRPLPPHTEVPKPTFSGYVPLPNKPGSSLYYAYYEAAKPAISADGSMSDTPILLWLQGGPGCASSFGAFYELGPFVTDEAGKLQPNPYSWSQTAGLLIIDQPVGVGYSIAANERDIPVDMEGMAEDLYQAIWGFFDAHQALQHRPFLITGESFGGKYIPSITHYILQTESQYAAKQQQPHKVCRRRPILTPGQHLDVPSTSSTSSIAAREASARHGNQAAAVAEVSGAHGSGAQLPSHQSSHPQQHPDAAAVSECWFPKHAREFLRSSTSSSSVPPPNFNLTGAAIGNGLTDPVPQTRALASVVYNLGLVSEATQAEISQRTEEVVQLVSQALWPQATQKRSELLDFIQQSAGVATLLDVRRVEGYDAGKAVDKLLDGAEMRSIMGAAPEVASYTSCSSVVEEVMAPDVMRSSLVLVEDILEVLPILLYQGQFDAQDGVAGSNAWIKNLDWAHARDFESQPGALWYVDNVPAGWQRSAATLTQVMIRNAGHMVPRDQPLAAQQMIQSWVAGVVAPAEVSGPKASSEEAVTFEV